jgi:hypothetical protein
MLLNYRFKKAGQIIDNLSLEDSRRLRKICCGIQQAQDDLLTQAQSLMRRCLTACEGLCCRNVQLDQIISLYDFIYLLIIAPSLKAGISECLEKENPLYSSDCLFLKDGSGPCIFPPHVRPEICITTFCGDDTPIRAQINRLTRSHRELYRFIRYARFRELKRSLINIVSDFRSCS